MQSILRKDYADLGIKRERPWIVCFLFLLLLVLLFLVKFLKRKKKKKSEHDSPFLFYVRVYIP